MSGEFNGTHAIWILSSRWLGVVAAARLQTVESKAGTSDRFPGTGILDTIPGRRTVSLARGITGSVALKGAMVLLWAAWGILSKVWNYVQGRIIVVVTRIV